jgi:outer membrane protein assembly factor BamB
MKNRLSIILISFSLVFFSGCGKHDVAPKKLREDFHVIWEYKFSVQVYYASPALSNDETTVFTGTSGWLTAERRGGQEFAAIDAVTGVKKWTIPLGASEVRSAPAVAADNSVYFSVELHDQVTYTFLGDEIWHVSSTGTILWKYNINPDKLQIEVGLSSPAIGSDGSVYIAGDRLYAFTPEGSLRWTAFATTPFSFVTMREMIRNSPVIGSDGTVYMAYHNIPLTAIDPLDGSVKWSLDLGVNDHCLASPAIGADGTIYVATQPGLLYAVSSTGQLKWTFDLTTTGFTGTLRSSPAIDENGCIYFGTNTGSPTSALFALNSDGTLKWIFEPGDLPDDVPSDHFDIYSSPALGTDNTLWFGQEFGRVYGLNRLTGESLGITETYQGITWSSPVISKTGVLYISDISGTLFALQTGIAGPDLLAPWPRYRGNNQSAGRK